MTGKKPGKRRATRAEVAYRSHTLLQLHDRGYGAHELEQYAVTNFGVSPRRARELVEDTYLLCVASISTVDLQRMGAGLLRRFEFLYREAIRQKRTDWAIQCNAYIAQHLYAPVRQFVVDNPPPPPAAPVPEEGEDPVPPEERF